MLIPKVMSAVFLFAAGMPGAGAFAQVVNGDPGGADPSVGHRELPDDPPMPRPHQPPSRSAGRSGPIIRGPYQSIQVNVDSFGDNILGDAANEPSLAIDPTDPNNIVIGWRQFDNVASNFRQSGWAYSHDRGQTWTAPGVLEPTVFSSDPVVEVDTAGGFYYYGLQPDRGPGSWACYLYKSFDAGRTWPQEVFAFGGDKAWMAVDRTTGIGRDNIYLYWTRTFSNCFGQFTRSYDGGATFVDCPLVLGNPQWGTMAVGPDGELYVVGDGFVVAKSTTMQDQAQPPQWDFALAVSLDGSMFFAGGPNPAGLLGQVWVATDHSTGPTRGNVYLLCSVSRASSPDALDVMFARSSDGGLTWSPPVRVNDDPTTLAYQWFGTMSVAPNGRIDVIWNDTRDDLGGFVSELYYAYSEDAGVTFSPNVPLTPAFDPHIGWPSQFKIGDYYDMISDDATASIAFSATFNGEQDVYFLRVGDCNNNGVHDGTDIATGTSADCNANAIPDDCEPDCNNNGVADECDITAGTSFDCNNNGIPDECEGDVCPPSPSPLTWDVWPAAASSSELTMAATQATDDTLPVEYFFFYWGDGGPNGDSSGWQTSRTYNDAGLFANTVHTYSVRARDSANPRNYGVYSFPGSAATHIETPAGIAFGVVDTTTIEVMAVGSFTNLAEGPSGLFFEMTPNEGSGANVWVQASTALVTGLTPGTTYTFRVRARNQEGLETAWVGPVAQMTTGGVPCVLVGDIDGDGLVNGGDIGGYTRAKLGQPPAPGEHPGCADYGTGTPDGDTVLFVTDLLTP